MLRQHKESQRIITATEMRRNFSAVIRRIRRRREHTIIQSSGESVAVLLPMAEYERLMKSERLAALDDLTRNLGREVEKRGLSEEELMAELEQTKRQVFEERYGRPA
jgi:prevent-host-death family protein